MRRRRVHQFLLRIHRCVHYSRPRVHPLERNPPQRLEAIEPSFFRENGYLRITDFGVARYNKPNNAEETSGTPGYMAPEVICRTNHSYESDFFALGVIIYEMMIGIVSSGST